VTNAPRSPEIRPKAPRIVAVALCAVAAIVVLAQCQMTADKVTGVATEMARSKQSKGNGSNCISKCSDKGEKDLDKEDDKHEKNIDKCDGDPTCIANENARHDAAVAQIQADVRACIDECHHQGGGHGDGDHDR
jgi:hypothetical protein